MTAVSPATRSPGKAAFEDRLSPGFSFISRAPTRRPGLDAVVAAGCVDRCPAGWAQVRDASHPDVAHRRARGSADSEPAGAVADPVRGTDKTL
ncbi:hypothetical protein GCM10023178_68980 [Actinomadura luteofluorescens]